MTEPILPPAEFEDQLRAALRAPEPEPEYVESLLRRVRQSPARPQKRAWLRPSLAYAALAAGLLALVFLLGGPSNVMAAVRDWLGGYLPGFGFVDQTSGLRAIPAPVRQERAGAVFTIDQAFTDTQRTIVVIGESRYAQPCPAPVDTIRGAQVREPYLLAGSERLDLQNWQASYLTFPALPAPVDKVTLYMPFQMMCDSGQPDWAVPLVFEPVAAGTLIPLLEGAPSATAAPLTAPAESAPQPAPEGASIRLKNVVRLQDGLLFSGWLEWSGETTRYRLAESEAVTLLDAAGHIYALEALPDQEVWALYPNRPANTLPWAFRLAGKAPSGPLTLRFPALLRTLDIPEEQGTFVLDLGPDPQPGQVWTPDLTVQAAGRALRLSEVRALPAPDRALSFTFESDAGVVFVAVADVAELSAGGGGGGSAALPAAGQVVSTLFYRQALPAGEHAFQIIAVEERAGGPWDTVWP